MDASRRGQGIDDAAGRTRGHDWGEICVDSDGTTFGVQVLLGHFGLEDGILLSIHPLSLEDIPGFKSFLAGAELGKSDYLFPGRLGDGGRWKMRVLCRPGGRYAIASVLGEAGKVVLVAETLGIAAAADTGSIGWVV